MQFPNDRYFIRFKIFAHQTSRLRTFFYLQLRSASFIVSKIFKTVPLGTTIGFPFYQLYPYLHSSIFLYVVHPPLHDSHVTAHVPNKYDIGSLKEEWNKFFLMKKIRIFHVFDHYICLQWRCINNCFKH